MIVPLGKLEKILDIKLDAYEVEEALTMAGFEVESVIRCNFSQINSKVVAAKVLSIDIHPNADKLILCHVDIGKKVLQVVCAAKNIRVNDFVSVAMIGSQLNKSDKFPEGIKIKKTKGDKKKYIRYLSILIIVFYKN